MATQQAVRRWIMTGAVAAITITGTIYGAGLKGDQEAKQKKQQLQKATPEEMIAQLEFARADLILKKNEMERKIANFQKRSQSKEHGQTEPK
ncbi:hypothetical protein N0V83_006169 [Neocucurbitaria cava]|uniref:Uncharacterized protein n=1 Tax=Neocucurbitaria cava TaxID=798079 RepID=A0A9W8Y7F1_9PLEO|nr:hypothetical protein N0V83_006169 [Neocucurbitaria cava]